MLRKAVLRPKSGSWSWGMVIGFHWSKNTIATDNWTKEWPFSDWESIPNRKEIIYA